MKRHAIGALPEDLLLGALSSSSGSAIIDACLGAALGYWIAPGRDGRTWWVAGSAAAVGTTGVLGALAVVTVGLCKRMA
jgi:hypothetical protein